MVRRGKGVISNKSYLRVEGRGGKEGDGGGLSDRLASLHHLQTYSLVLISNLLNTYRSTPPPPTPPT